MYSRKGREEEEEDKWTRGGEEEMEAKVEKQLRTENDIGARNREVWGENNVRQQTSDWSSMFKNNQVHNQ